MKRNEPHIQIRRAVPDDAASIAQVLREAFVEYEEFYTREGFAATTPGPEQIGNRLREGPAWVAVHLETIVGTASAVVRDEGLYIRGMAVLPSARGRKVGELLLAEIEGYAAAHKCRRLFLSTTPFLCRAIRLYEQTGFRRSEQEGPHDLFGTPLFTMVKTLATSD
jgi:GNAT superfamily N-acetyltransferase